MIKTKKKAEATAGESNSEWSTKRVGEIIKFYDRTGVMPRDNPFFKGDVNMRRAGLKFAYSRDELAEMATSARDILHFGETHAKVMTDEGVRVVRLRKYQSKVLLQYRKFRFNVFLASRQCGKCITFDTLVYLPIEGSTDYQEIPIFELYYLCDGVLSWADRIERSLYRMLYRVKLALGEEIDQPRKHK